MRNFQIVSIVIVCLFSIKQDMRFFFDHNRMIEQTPQMFEQFAAPQPLSFQEIGEFALSSSLCEKFCTVSIASVFRKICRYVRKSVMKSRIFVRKNVTLLCLFVRKNVVMRRTDRFMRSGVGCNPMNNFMFYLKYILKSK